MQPRCLKPPILTVHSMPNPECNRVKQIRRTVLLLLPLSNVSLSLLPRFTGRAPPSLSGLN